jgi:hypothetical protein
MDTKLDRVVFSEPTISITLTEMTVDDIDLLLRSVSAELGASGDDPAWKLRAALSFASSKLQDAIDAAE